MVVTGTERLRGGLAHLLLALAILMRLLMVGLIPTLLLWACFGTNLFLYRRYRGHSPFVANHAGQAVGFQVALFVLVLLNRAFVLVLWLVLGLAGVIPVALMVGADYLVDFIFLLLSGFAAARGFRGKSHTYPLAGSLIRRFFL